MADPVTDPVAGHDARYGEEGAGPPQWARVRDRLARAGVAWFTTTRRAWTHGHGTRSTERMGLILEPRPGSPGEMRARRDSNPGAVALPDRRTR
jgi:hypothetical protein